MFGKFCFLFCFVLLLKFVFALYFVSFCFVSDCEFLLLILYFLFCFVLLFCLKVKLFVLFFNFTFCFKNETYFCFVIMFYFLFVSQVYFCFSRFCRFGVGGRVADAGSVFVSVGPGVPRSCWGRSLGRRKRGLSRPARL